MIPAVGAAEAAPAHAESAPRPAAPSFGSAPAQAPAAQMPLPPAPAQPAQGQGTGAHPTAPATADDLDLIEKEWVERAKAIVARTRTDPYAQNKEMNQYKADYLKKRYQKDIRVEP